MIGIAKDYAAIAIGTAAVGTSRALATSRAAVGAVTSLGGHRKPTPDVVGEHLRDAGADLAATTQRSRELIAALIQSELERAVARLGLVPESELDAVRQKLARLERQVASARPPQG